jgi:hypothetical protein
MKRLLPVIVLPLLMPLTAAAQAPAPVCAAAPPSALRFMLGSWELTNARGIKAGTSQVSTAVDGCATVERYTGTKATIRFELTLAHDTPTRTWFGVLVDSQGAVYVLKGGFEQDQLILQGESRDAKGVPVLNKVTWRSIDADHWEQEWLLSNDDGKSWGRSFKVIYARLS